MKFATVETPLGALRHVRVTETRDEEEAGLRGFGPAAAMLFSHAGPVTMEGVRWPLWLVWLRPQPYLGRGFFVVQEKLLAFPGSYATGVIGTQLLEVPVEWGPLFQNAGRVRVFGLS